MDLRPGEWFVRARMIAEAGKSDGLQFCNANRTNVRHVKRHKASEAREESKGGVVGVRCLPGVSRRLS